MLKLPEHQVAGHQGGSGKLGPLIDDSGRFYKPLQGDERGAHEVSFYTSFSQDTRVPDHIHKYFPVYHGTELVEASDGSGLQPHLVLGDLTAGRVCPSIMDIKIGSRTWPPEAPEEYVAKCLRKDRASSSIYLGFRFSGLQFFSCNGSESWKAKKKAVQSFSAEEVGLILRNFVSSNTSKELELKPDCALASVVFGSSTGILSQLLELKTWFEDQTTYHFYSASVLIMFEKHLAIKEGSPKAEVKLIDFAHVADGKGTIDHNFLGGLCSLIKFVSEVLKSSEVTQITDHSKDIPQKDQHVFENGIH